jgi:hypothetical protein
VINRSTSGLNIGTGVTAPIVGTTSIQNLEDILGQQSKFGMLMNKY